MNEKKNIYISGKITGVENFAEIFANKEQELTEQGHQVFNPAKHPDMFSWQQFMELDLKALSFCDSIYMMNGWETSKGAKLELEEAKKLGLEIIYESPEHNIEKSEIENSDAIKSLSDVESKKEELIKNSLLTKDYVKDFEDKMQDDSLSDGELLEIAKNYIKELQNLHQKEIIIENKEPEYTATIHPYLKTHYPEIYSKLTDDDIHNMEYFSELSSGDDLVDEIMFSENAIFKNNEEISFEEFINLAKRGIESNIDSNLPFVTLDNSVKKEVMKEKNSLDNITKSTWNLLESYYEKKYDFELKGKDDSATLENIIQLYEVVRKEQRLAKSDLKSYERDTPETDALGALRLKYTEIVAEQKKEEAWNSPSVNDDLSNSFHEVMNSVKADSGKKTFSENITKKFEEMGLNDDNGQPIKSEKIHTVNEPQKKGIGYKVFYLKNGKLYPPMVQNPNGEATPMNSWIEASAGEIAGKTTTGRPQVKKGGRGTHSSPGFLAYRPGWHLGDVPIARQFSKTNPENGVKELFPAEFVWAECEYAADVDYQKEAMANGYTENGAFRHSYAGLQKLPENGSYRYRTNPDPNTEEWIITGKIKVNRILSNNEVDELCKKAGKEPQKREPGNFDEVEQKFIKAFSSDLKNTHNIDTSFSNIVKDFNTEELNKFDSIIKVKLGEKYNRSQLLDYLSDKVDVQKKGKTKNSYIRGL